MEEKLKDDVKRWNSKVVKMVLAYQVLLVGVIVCLTIINDDLISVGLIANAILGVSMIILIVTAKKFAKLMDEPLSEATLKRFFTLTLWRQIPFLLVDLIWLADFVFVFYIFIITIGSSDSKNQSTGFAILFIYGIGFLIVGILVLI